MSTPIYTASKHAILGLTKAYGDAFNYNLTGIKVIAYCVGPIESSSSAHRFKSPAHERAWKLDMSGVQFQKFVDSI
jgi:15-hydroxyprostaglandin dehydrogenase (NAD)